MLQSQTPPSLQYHFYQPMWTLVGAGAKTLEQSRRLMAQVVPPQADWLQTSVSEFCPEENTIITADGQKVKYDYLIVALGLQLNFNKVKQLGSVGGIGSSVGATK